MARDQIADDGSDGLGDQLSWGVAPGYDEYRRWRKNRPVQLNDEHNVGSNWPTAMFNIAKGIALGTCAPTGHDETD
ncbi:MAG: hypothetical protein ACK5LQ_09950 [Planctomycetota bacterium]